MRRLPDAGLQGHEATRCSGGAQPGVDCDPFHDAVLLLQQRLYGSDSHQRILGHLGEWLLKKGEGYDGISAGVRLD